VDEADKAFRAPGEREPRDARRESDARGTLERTLADLIRRGIEAGRGGFERVGDSIAPRDVASGIASQIGDLRQAIVRAVAQEVGMFLREADIARELRKVVNGMSIEATVKLGFDDEAPHGTKVEAKVDAKTGPESKRRPAAKR